MIEVFLCLILLPSEMEDEHSFKTKVVARETVIMALKRGRKILDLDK